MQQSGSPAAGAAEALQRREPERRGGHGADISDAGITQLSVYCTGDWDAERRAEHAAAVTLIRP